MDTQKHFNYIIDKLNLLGWIYIHKVEEDKKWRDFKNRNIKECLRDEFYLAENSQENKYYNKRVRQFSNVAKLLLVNECFINDVLKISETFQLNEIAFGMPKSQCEPLTEASRKKYAKLPNDYMLYNYEITQQCLALWKCWIEYQSLRYLKKYKGKINFQQSEERLNKNIYYQKIPFINFNSKLDALLNKYNLSKLWEDSIQLLLITGKMFVPNKFCPILITKNKDEVTITIPIYKETQLEDIKYKWKDIKSLKDKHFGTKHIKSYSNIDQSISILKEKIQGTRYWDLIDLEKLNVPFGQEQEIKAYNRIRKASFRVKRAADKLTGQKREGKTFIDEFSEFIGLDNPTFKY